MKKHIPTYYLISFFFFFFGTTVFAQGLDYEELIDSVSVNKKLGVWQPLIYIASSYILTNDTISESRRTELNLKKIEGFVAIGAYEEALTLKNDMVENATLLVENQRLLLYEVSKVYEHTSLEYKSMQALDEVAALYDTKKLNTGFSEYLNRKASVYKTFKKDHLAKVYALEALRMSALEGEREQTAEAYALLGFLERKETKKKLEYLIKSYHIFDELGLAFKSSQVTTNLGVFYIETDKADEALFYLNMAEKKLSGQNNPEPLSEIYKYKSIAYEHKKVMDSALFYQRESSYFYNIFQKNLGGIKLMQFDLKNNQLQRMNEKKKYLANIYGLKQEKQSLVLSIVLTFLILATIIYLLFKNKNQTKRIKLQNNKIAQQNDALAVSLDEKSLLLQELNHRVKNNLSLIVSLIKFQSKALNNPIEKQKLLDLENRIRAISFAHEQFIYTDDLNEKKIFNLKNYIHNIIESLKSMSTRKIDFEIEIEAFYSNIDTALPIGILINELVTNSLEHARTDEDYLKITIIVKIVKTSLHLNYKDNGVEFKYVKDSKSLGLFIINSMVQQLKGTIDRVDAEYTITLKVK